MRLKNAKVLLTGAAGGIGRAMVTELMRRGAQVLMVDRDEGSLVSVSQTRPFPESQREIFVADLTDPQQRSRLCHFASTWRGGVNVLINNAGLNPFGLFDELSPEEIDKTLALNTLAPMHLCHRILPHLRAQPHASILNIGSVFGGIGYPGYVTYSASKFAIRGFTEALRRELASTTVKVHYLAPRATRTPINSTAIERMNAKLGVAMDSPETVARAAVSLLETQHPSAVVGWPEKFFVRLNALFPRVVDRAVSQQLSTIEHYAQRRNAEPVMASAPMPRRQLS